MAETKFLITRATGRTGGYAVRLLLERKAKGNEARPDDV